MQKVLNRASEPSTYAGLAGIVSGLGMIFDINEAEPIVQAAGHAAEAVLATGNPAMGIATLLFGLLGVFMPERKSDGKAKR